MAILNIDKKVFEKEIGKITDELQNKIALFGTPVESLKDNNLELEIFPNRPDLLSYQNFKNSFLSFLNKNPGLRKIKVNKPEKNFTVKIDSSVKNIRPYTFCAIVKNLKFDDEKIKEIIDLQEKLHITLGRKRKKAAIGIYPLDKITLPINYKALSPEKIKFRPLEFPKEINGRQILSQHSAGREYGNLLQGMDKYPVFIDANNNILSMPPIINSHETGKIDSNTKEIFIECSGFDRNVLEKILNIIVYSFESMGGKVFQMNLLYEDKKLVSPNVDPEKMKISLENTNKLLGLELKENDIKKLLGKMGHDYKNKIVSILSTRTDILHEVDLIEDIAIAYGYDNFIPEIPEISTIGEIDRKEILKQKIANILVGLNLLETSSYHLINKDTIKKIGFNLKDFIQIKNSKTEYEYLRKDLSSFLLKIYSENVDVEYPQNIFQIGRVFDNYKERDNLAIAVTPGNFTKLKQILEYLERMLNINLQIKNSSEHPNHFIQGRTGYINFKGKDIGFIGEISPKVLRNFRLKMPVVLLEINLKDIFEELN